MQLIRHKGQDGFAVGRRSLFSAEEDIDGNAAFQENEVLATFVDQERKSPISIEDALVLLQLESKNLGVKDVAEAMAVYLEGADDAWVSKSVLRAATCDPIVGGRAIASLVEEREGRGCRLHNNNDTMLDVDVGVARVLLVGAAVVLV